MSKVIFCTKKLPFARYIAWWTRGYGHAALISDRRPGMWLEATFSGVDYYPAPPLESLHKYDIVELPFDIEEAGIKHIGTRYNFRGIIASFFHFRWKPNGRFCDQEILRMLAESGHPIIDESLEDEIDPVQCRNLLNAYLRGMKYDEGKREGNRPK